MEVDDFQFTLIPADTPLDNLFNEWAPLTEKITKRSFFHQPQWFACYLAAYPETKQNTCFIKLHNKRTILGVFPVQYVKINKFGLSLNVWQVYWPSDMGLNDFVYPHDVSYKTILRHLSDFLNQQHNLPWHLLHLQNVPENSSIAYSLSLSSTARHIGVYHHDSKLIACKARFEESIAGISSKFKRNIRRKLRKLEKSGVVTFQMAENEPELQEAFEQFVEIEASNWKGHNKTALKFDKQRYLFYQKLLELFGKNKQCRIHSLWLDDQPIASQFALAINDTFHLLKIGYNAEYHDIGPGGILLNETIRRFSGNDHIKKISFVTGAKWNDDWSPQIIRVYDHFIYNKNIKGYIAFSVEKAKSTLQQLKHKLTSNGNN